MSKRYPLSLDGFGISYEDMATSTLESISKELAGRLMDPYAVDPSKRARRMAGYQDHFRRVSAELKRREKLG